jgi:hypothetical protein
MHDGDIKQIDLEAFAAIRSATTVTIRETRGLFTPSTTPARWRGPIERSFRDARAVIAIGAEQSGRRKHIACRCCSRCRNFRSATNDKALHEVVRSIVVQLLKPQRSSVCVHMSYPDAGRCYNYRNYCDYKRDSRPYVCPAGFFCLQLTCCRRAFCCFGGAPHELRLFGVGNLSSCFCFLVLS